MSIKAAHDHDDTRFSYCPHVISVGQNTWEDVHKKQQMQTSCESCGEGGPNLWLCLHSRCLYVGCGGSSSDHSTDHAEAKGHYLTLNMTTMRIWCYKCECEVYKKMNNPPLMMRDRSLSLTPLSDPVSPERKIQMLTPVHLSPTRSRAHAHGYVPTHARGQTSSVEESESDDEDENHRPRGLTGLQNIGNTCYMNAALQSLSNCPPLTRYFLHCQGFVRTERRPMLSKSYTKLITEMWHRRRPSYVVPSVIAHGIKIVHPMFKGFSQQDTQEFLRCFMDQLHEELKQPDLVAAGIDNNDVEETEGTECSTDATESTESSEVDSSSQQPLIEGVSDTEYETCDSGVSSERSSVEPADTNLSSADEGSERSKESSDEIIVSNTDATDQQQDVDENSTEVCKSRPSEVIVNDEERDVDTSGVCNSNKDNIIEREDSAVGSMTSMEKLASCESFSKSKERKDSANLAHKHCSHGSDDHASSETLNDVQQIETEAGEYSDAVSEIDPVQVQSSTGSKTYRPNLQAEADKKVTRHPSESDKIGKSHSAPSVSGTHRAKKKNTILYKSVISDIFDGKILSSVQCRTCERVSSTKETFQDLSLPIPSKDHLHVLHAQQGSITPHKGSCGEVAMNPGWISWMFGWMKSWFWGPNITLQDCLGAFFSPDELKGDNMYSCEKCKKLRNGVKYSEVLALPEQLFTRFLLQRFGTINFEILCIHLKRFRHEFMYSTKISSYVSFPLEDLDMRPYVHKDCKDQIMAYELVAVICHHGTAGGGHYTSYALNYVNEQWYEFDDQYVTEVDIQQVENCEAYVLFYRKKNDRILALREKAQMILECTENSFMKFFVSKQWINKFNTFAEPGPITNYDFLCRHRVVHPYKWSYVHELVQEVPQALWEFLHEKFGGGPAVNHLYQCNTCQQELERLKKRQTYEMETFVQMHDEFQKEENPDMVYAISMTWFREWENFVRGRTDEPPGPIDNSKIAITKNGQTAVKANSDCGQVSAESWAFFHDIYGGGPDIMLKQSGTNVQSSETKPNESGDGKHMDNVSSKSS